MCNILQSIHHEIADVTRDDPWGGIGLNEYAAVSIEPMKINKYGRNCIPSDLTSAVKMISGKWKVEIIWHDLASFLTVRSDSPSYVVCCLE